MRICVDLYDELLNWGKRKEQPVNHNHLETLHDKSALFSDARSGKCTDLSPSFISLHVQ